MHRKNGALVLTLLAALALSACGNSDADATPTVNVELVRTQAVLTYQVELTQTALANPTSTPSPTESPTSAPTLAFPTAGSPVASATTSLVTGGQSSSCYGLSYVKDVTIPDNTDVTPGQSFTKTWQVSNTGTCAWESGFKFNVVGGDAMGGSAVTLNQRVEPGSLYEFSVPMVAPTNKSGEVKGTWRLSDANGNFFGDGVYVLVDVTGTAPTTTTEPTTAPTATATATQTP